MIVFRKSIFGYGLRILVALGLAGCVASSDVPEIVPGTPYVSVSNGGSIFGGSSTTIYEGDVVIFRSHDGTPDSVREGFAVLRIGGYDRLRDAALVIIASVEVEADAPACMDYGSDVIEVRGAQVDAAIAASCPGSEVIAAQVELRRLLDAEIVD